MTSISMRTFPGLFVGRRTIVLAQEAMAAGPLLADSQYLCGACDEPVMTCAGAQDMRDTVVKCRCGEFNQV